MSIVDMIKKRGIEMLARLDHINLTVNCLEESIWWYQKLFGFEKVEHGVNASGSLWAIIARDDSMIAMTEYPKLKPANQKQEGLSHKIFHFGIRVSSAEVWKEKVRNYNLRLYYGGEVEYPYSTSWYIRDPSGHEIEVSCSDGLPLKFN
jgi:catechol 2,3-dioxygenase-like lactoylglutathione lyase family enzyme